MFDKAEQRATELENNYKLLDTWKRRGDDLLYSMIPKTVADRLRTGDSPLSTCEVGHTCKINPYCIKYNIIFSRLKLLQFYFANLSALIRQQWKMPWSWFPQ